LKQPIVAIQNAVTPQENPTAMALVVFAQLFGGALFVSIGEVIFSTGLASGLAEYAPTVVPSTVINAGASAFRQVITTEQVPGVLKAYSSGIDHTLYLATGSVGMALLFVWGMGWKKVSQGKK
jgi:hypothetical protein